MGIIHETPVFPGITLCNPRKKVPAWTHAGIPCKDLKKKGTGHQNVEGRLKIPFEV
jgi:hypothetical protein